jgi:hypothetical protein
LVVTHVDRCDVRGAAFEQNLREASRRRACVHHTPAVDDEPKRHEGIESANQFVGGARDVHIDSVGESQFGVVVNLPRGPSLTLAIDKNIPGRDEIVCVRTRSR